MKYSIFQNWTRRSASAQEFLDGEEHFVSTFLQNGQKQTRFDRPIIFNNCPSHTAQFFELMEPTTPKLSSLLRRCFCRNLKQCFLAGDKKLGWILEVHVYVFGNRREFALSRLKQDSFAIRKLRRIFNFINITFPYFIINIDEYLFELNETFEHDHGMFIGHI